MKTNTLFAALLSMALFTAARAQEPAKVQLDHFIDRLVEKNKAMGSLVIAKEGNVLYNRAFGYSQEITAMNRPNTYTYLTTIASPGLFRLKIVDLDGQYVYSKVLLVRPENISSRIFLLKNPITDGIAHLAINSERAVRAEFLIYDAAGRLVKKLSMQLSIGNNFLSIPLGGLKSSVYSLIYKDAFSEPLSLRLVKVGGD